MRSGCLNLVFMVVAAAVAVVAGYFFVRVGWSVWRDLRGHRSEAGSKEEQEERGSAEHGGQ